MKRSMIVLGIILIALLFSGCTEEQSNSAVSPKSWNEIKSIVEAMPVSERPQFITITFDDALHSVAYDYTQKVLGYGHTNPNGAPIPVTYYISNEYTNYHLVQQRYAQGNEIAVHTVTHTTGTEDSYDKWRAEIVQCKEHLVNLAGVPAEKIKGFRAPFLAHSDYSFRVLWEEGFLYESSVTEQIGNNSKDVTSFIFPYAFDSLGTQDYSVGEGPSQPYPGLWEVPMWGWHNASGQLIANMDPSGMDVLSMFNETFDTRYSSNRAPIGVFLHPGWLNTQSNADALNAFLVNALGHNGVWVVTGSQMIEWMKNPVPISQMNDFEAVQYIAPASGPEVADGWDNDGDGDVDEGFVKNCSYGGYNFATTADECPDEYPWLEINKTYAINVSVIGDTVGTTECEDPAWKSGTAYSGGSRVSHNGHAWYAKWYETSEPGKSQWAGWVDEGECASDIIEFHGSVSPVGKVNVAEGSNAVFVVTPDSGYRIADVVVDGASVGAFDSIFIDNVRETHTVVASFEVDDNAVFWNVTATAGNGGSINPEAVTSVREGSSQAYTITPDAGYRIADVTVNGSSKGAIDTYTITNVTGDSAIAATFELIPTYTFTVTATAGGTVTPGDTTVVEGDSVAYIITPATGYRIVDVKRDTVSLGAVSSVMLWAESNQTLAVTFEAIPTYTVDLTVGANGSATPGDTTLVEGETTTYTFDANSGYRIADVVVNGSSLGAVTTYTVPAADKNYTIAVTFEEIPLVYNSVTITATEGGTVTGDTSVLQSTDAEYTFTPEAGYRIVDVKLDGVSKGAVTSLTIPAIAADHVLEVAFEAIPTFTFSATAGNGGSITPAGDTVVEENSVVTYSIAANAGYRIVDVTVDGVSKGNVTSVAVTATKDIAVAAIFEVIPTFTLTATAGANGSISPAGDSVVVEGTELTYTITADAGYQITDVTVNGVSKGAVSSVVVTADADYGVAATFEIIPVVYYDVTVQVTGNGSISTDATFTVEEGTDTVITFTPAAGYQIGTVVLNGQDQGAVTSVSLSNISADQSVAVTFEEESGSICDGVADWDANQNWTTYTIGDKRVNNGKVWEVKVTHYAFYEPSSTWGYLGWKEVGSCQ